MKDVEKTNVERDNSSKRLRRRKRKMNLYGFIVILLVLTAGITVSYTFLFNIEEIRVSGESDLYSAEEIVDASGIMKGDNLLRLNKKRSEKKILDELIYVETAEIDMDFPSSLVINVSKCIPSYNINYDSGTLLVSKKGKILENNSFITPGLPIFYGFDPDSKEPGQQLKSADPQKDTAFDAFIDKMSDPEVEKISSIDMSDKYEITVNFENGIIFRMGNWTDVEYKMDMAGDVMSAEGIKGKSGYITMIGSNQCSFRTSDSPAAIPENIEPTTGMGDGQPATDTNGMPLATAPTVIPPTEQTMTEPMTEAVYAGDGQGEYNAEEEQMFREHDEMIQQSSTESAEPVPEGNQNE